MGKAAKTEPRVRFGFGVVFGCSSSSSEDERPSISIGSGSSPEGGGSIVLKQSNWTLETFVGHYIFVLIDVAGHSPFSNTSKILYSSIILYVVVCSKLSL